MLNFTPDQDPLAQVQSTQPGQIFIHSQKTYWLVLLLSAVAVSSFSLLLLSLAGGFIFFAFVCFLPLAASLYFASRQIKHIEVTPNSLRLYYWLVQQKQIAFAEINQIEIRKRPRPSWMMVTMSGSIILPLGAVENMPVLIKLVAANSLMQFEWATAEKARYTKQRP